MTVRPALPDDAPALARLLIQVQDQHVREHPEVFRTICPDDAARHVAAEIASGNYAVHAADAVDGMVKWAVHDRAESIYAHAARICMVDQIVVDAVARRRGIGRRLLSWVEDRAREAGASRVQLDTWSSNADGLATFRTVGYRPFMIRQWLWMA